MSSLKVVTNPKNKEIDAFIKKYPNLKDDMANMIKEDKKENLNRIEDEMLYKYASRLLNNGLEADYFVFGHRHRPVDIELKPGRHMVILGDWLTNFTYAEFDGNDLNLKYFKNEMI